MAPLKRCRYSMPGSRRFKKLLHRSMRCLRPTRFGKFLSAGVDGMRRTIPYSEARADREIGMQPASVAPDASTRIKNGVLVLSGYGVRVAVRRRHLIVEDGIGRDRRWGRLSRATARLKRLVVLGHTGFVTLEALRWLGDVGAAFVQIDVDGQLIGAFGPQGRDEARLRRTQALAVTHPVGLAITKWLIREKLT